MAPQSRRIVEHTMVDYAGSRSVGPDIRSGSNAVEARIAVAVFVVAVFVVVADTFVADTFVVDAVGGTIALPLLRLS